MDVLGVLLGRLAGSDPLSKSGVRNQVDRWKRAGLATTAQMLGETWVTPTRTGLDRVELPWGVWGMPVTRLRHCHAVNVVRLWWEGQEHAQQSPWVCERWCYQERGKSTAWHIPDGKVLDPRANQDGPTQFLAFEIELTHKGRPAYETEVFGKLQAGTVGVMYYVETEQFADRLRSDIRAVLERRGQQTRWQVSLLPEVHGVSYAGKW